MTIHFFSPVRDGLLHYFTSALLFILFLSCVSACTHNHATEDGHQHDEVTQTHEDDDHADGTHAHDDNSDHAAADGDHHEEGIHLTSAQLESMDIRFGDFTEMKLNDYLGATGTLGLPPNAYAAVSARAPGFIRNARNYVEGDYVKRGAVISFLENPEFIEHQREYLEARAELTFLRQELDRQETLLQADAGVLKEAQRLRSQVDAKTATVRGLQMRLAYLGIKTEGLTPDNITKSITLFAPRSGYITTISLHDGIYVEPNTQLMEIIDEEHIHLELDVFERDIARLKKGQHITYHIPALGSQRFEAEVHVIGKEFNTKNKTVRVHAHLIGEQPPFIRDLFAEARIWLTDQSVAALPEGAIVREGELSYVYASSGEVMGGEMAFERLLVNPGNTENGYTSVKMIDPLPEGMRIVTENAYFVYAQGMAGELVHDH